MDNNRNLQTNLYKNHTKTKFMEENSMKKNNKNKANNKKRIVTSLLVVALALLMVVGVFMLSPMKASVMMLPQQRSITTPPMIGRTSRSISTRRTSRNTYPLSSPVTAQPIRASHCRVAKADTSIKAHSLTVTMCSPM